MSLVNTLSTAALLVAAHVYVTSGEGRWLHQYCYHESIIMGTA